MLIKTMQVGLYGTNCYVVTDGESGEAAVIDPGDDAGAIMDYLEGGGLKCVYIFVTHGHFDHTTAVNALAAETGATVCMHRSDIGMKRVFGIDAFIPPEDTVYYGEGDTFNVGKLTFSVMETPGHSQGSVTLVCGNALFTGDTLFRDSIGRTDLPGGDMDTLMRSLRRLRELPGDFEVYPGHMATTTLERERRFNYYMLNS